MFAGIAPTLAGLISKLLFHHDYPGGHGFDGFVTDVIALVLAGVGIALLASFGVAIWKRARRRPGGSPGRVDV